MTTGLFALAVLGGSRAHAQGSRPVGATVSGPNSSFTWVYTPGYGYSYSSTQTGGGFTTTINVGAPPVYVLGPGAVYAVPVPNRGLSVSSPGSSFNWIHTPGFGNYYNANQSAGGVSSSIFVGNPPPQIVGGVVYGVPYRQRAVPRRVRRRW